MNSLQAQPAMVRPESQLLPNAAGVGRGELLARVAVLIPCFNEEPTIGSVVREFQAALPCAAIFVFDNASTDRTADEARAAGAEVLHEHRRGKGHVVQSMFRKIDADAYVIVDGDGTYPAAEVERLVAPVLRGEADMVIGSRLHQSARSDFRPLNRFGNHVFLALLNSIFGVRLTDLLSGYRAFSRRLVRGVPLFGGGFETEAELTIKALQRGFVIAEEPIDLGERPAGSYSKIRIVRDGVLILLTMLQLIRDYRSLSFFGCLGVVLFALALIPAGWVFAEFSETGMVHRLPSAVLATGLALAGALAVTVGLVLHTIARHFRELDARLLAVTDDLHRAVGGTGRSG
jgi:glycosyltransferase involved in cell wall biosynthesis